MSPSSAKVLGCEEDSTAAKSKEEQNPQTSCLVRFLQGEFFYLPGIVDGVSRKLLNLTLSLK